MSFNVERKGQPVAVVQTDKAKIETPVWFDADDPTGTPRVEISKEKQLFLSPVPPSLVTKQEREVWYLSGKSGAGKSYLTAELSRWYANKGKKIFVFSPVKDAKLAKLGATFLDIDDLVATSNSYEKANAKYQEMKIRFKYQKKKIEDPEMLMKMELRLNELKPDPSKKGRLEMKLSPDEMKDMFSDSVIVFDDYQEGSTAGNIKLIEFLRDFYLTTGRHTRTNMILCHHLSNDREKTRMILTECSNIVLYCKNTPKSREYMLDTYLKFNKYQIAQVEKRMKLRDRWVMYDRDSQILMTPKTLWLA